MELTADSHTEPSGMDNVRVRELSRDPRDALSDDRLPPFEGALQGLIMARYPGLSSPPDCEIEWHSNSRTPRGAVLRGFALTSFQGGAVYAQREGANSQTIIGSYVRSHEYAGEHGTYHCVQIVFNKDFLKATSAA